MSAAARHASNPSASQPFGGPATSRRGLIAKGALGAVAVPTPEFVAGDADRVRLLTMISDLDPLFSAIHYDVDALLEAACDAQGEFPAACALVVVAEHIRGLLDRLWDWHEAATPLAHAALGAPGRPALVGRGHPG